MKVFDFDKTIYKRISSFEFALEAIKREPSLLKYSPIMLGTVIKYLTNTLDLDEITKAVEKNIKVVTDRKDLIDSISLTFWNEDRLKRLNKDMISLVAPEDVICSSSPSFVIDGVRDYLPTKNIITTTLNFETGELFLNAMENKVKKIKELYPDGKIEVLFTDSYSDRPLMDIADQVILIKDRNFRVIKEMAKDLELEKKAKKETKYNDIANYPKNRIDNYFEDNDSNEKGKCLKKIK